MGSDAAPTDAAPADARGPRCNARAPFERLTPVVSLNTDQSDEGLSLSSDEQTAWFSSTRPGGTRDPKAVDYDLYQATRTQAGTFTSIQPIPGASSISDERVPQLSTDGLVLFADGVAGAGKRAVKIARRDSSGDSFPAMTLVDAVNDGLASDNTSAFLVITEGQRGALYFISNRPVQGVTPGLYRLYRSDYNAGTVGAPARVDIVGLPSGDINVGNPVVTPDELVVYFSITPSTTLTGEIYVASRTSPTAAFANPLKLDTLSSAMLRGPSWLSDDSCRLYVTQASDKGPLIYDIFVAERTPDPRSRSRRAGPLRRSRTASSRSMSGRHS